MPGSCHAVDVLRCPLAAISRSRTDERTEAGPAGGACPVCFLFGGIIIDTHRIHGTGMIYHGLVIFTDSTMVNHNETSIRGKIYLHGCLIFMVFMSVNIQSSHGWYGI